MAKWGGYDWLRPTLLGVIVAAMHGYCIWSALANRSYLTDDSVQYLTLAENLADQGIFSQCYTPPYVADLQRTPGYPVFLILLGRLPWLVIVAQHLLVLATAWFLYRLARDLYGERIGGMGARLYLLQPYPVVLASYVLSETLFIFLLVGGLWAYLRFWRGDGWRWLAGGLALLGLAALVRPVGLPLLGLGAVLAMGRATVLRKQWAAQWGLAVIVPLLVVGPWLWRNHDLSGRVVFSTMGDMGMLHGRLGGLEAWRTGQPMDEQAYYMAGDSVAAMRMGLAAIRQYPAGTQTHETEQLADGMGQLTYSFYWQHPWDALCFQARNIWEMAKGLGYGWALELTQSGPAALAMAGVQGIWNLLMYLGLLLALWRIREWGHPEWLAFGVVAVVLLVSAAAWADGRYRMVVDPFILLSVLFILRRQERLSAGQAMT